MPSDRKLLGAGDHIAYEAEMLAESANMLRKGTFPDGAIKNALVEAFAVHARNLLHFFFPENRQKDDVLAEHYIGSKDAWKRGRGDCPAALNDTRDMVNKQIAHLTFDRVGKSPAEKTWYVEPMLTAFGALLCDFVNYADVSLLATKDRERLSTAAKAMLQPPSLLSSPQPTIIGTGPASPGFTDVSTSSPK